MPWRSRWVETTEASRTRVEAEVASSVAHEVAVVFGLMEVLDLQTSLAKVVGTKLPEHPDALNRASVLR